MQTGIYLFETVVFVVWIASLAWVVTDTRKTGKNSFLWGGITFIFGPLALLAYYLKRD